MKLRSQSRYRDGTAKSRYGRRRSTVEPAPTFQLSPQPSPLTSSKLYACQVFVERTTATRCSPSVRGRRINGA
jgi:hypothetical protein